MEFKDIIKKLREDNKLSFAELAVKFDKTESAIRAWELGRTKPDADTLIKLSAFFNCTVDYLLGLSEYKNIEEIERIKNISENSRMLFSKFPPDVRNIIADTVSLLISLLYAFNESELLQELTENMQDIIFGSCLIFSHNFNFDDLNNITNNNQDINFLSMSDEEINKYFDAVLYQSINYRDIAIMKIQEIYNNYRVQLFEEQCKELNSNNHLKYYFSEEKILKST